MNIPAYLDHVLPRVRKPGRYIGGELNAVTKQWLDRQVHFCLVFPDLYEIGMSHQGLQLLYFILNRHEKALAHRCFTPDVDMEEILRSENIPLFSLEIKAPLKSYDVIGVTLPYELCYTNILTVLDLASIPLFSRERSEDDPLIIGGGSGALNPEPAAPFFDAIALGDGEEITAELASVLFRLKKDGCSRRKRLEALSTLEGMYVPSFFEPRYQGDKIVGIAALKPGYTRVTRRVVPRMPPADLLNRPLVPVVKPVHDRLGIEIARGCTRGCRFCQAGIIYRPVRERSLSEIMAMAEAGIAAGGFDELALLSLSTGDYSCINRLLPSLMDRFADEYVSVSVPSMRVGTLNAELMDQIRRVRKTGFTVAPEAGTDRLREVINKGITEDDLLATCKDAFALGWKLIKFYFMIGLPTETENDVAGIASLSRKARAMAPGEMVKQVNINVSIGTFVPKPHTPFQWERQLSIDESYQKIEQLKQLLPRKGFSLKWHDPKQSFLEGVFSRGDRKLASLIVTAWKNGQRLDGWSEHFSLERWQEAAGQCDVELETYLRARDKEEVLPWDHLHTGVSRDFLLAELEKGLKQQYTKDCRIHGCRQCGLCDFQTLQPVVHKTNNESDLDTGRLTTALKKPVNQQAALYRVHYSRVGNSRFYGHLDLLQLVFRALHRAGFPVLFSQGYNPSPKVSFSPALPVGVESLAEYFYMELAGPLDSTDAARNILNKQLPETIRVSMIEQTSSIRQHDVMATYQIHCKTVPKERLHKKIAFFLQQDEVIIERVRKRRKRRLDLRPMVAGLAAKDESLELVLFHYHGKAGTNPREILVHGLHLTEQEALLARIKKIAVHELQTSS